MIIKRYKKRSISLHRNIQQIDIKLTEMIVKVLLVAIIAIAVQQGE